MRRPYNGTATVTRPYGVVDPAYSNYPGSKHPGTDYGLGYRRQQVAAISGTVTVYARGSSNVGRGNEVVITNGNTQVKYCHLDSISVANGQQVQEGTVVGLTGFTGYVIPKSQAGSHQHFEVLINGSYVDPETQYNEGGEMPITKGQEDVESFIATGGYPGKGYNYRFTGLEANQTNLDAFVNFWNDISKSVGLQKRVSDQDKQIAQLSKALALYQAQAGDVEANVVGKALLALLKTLGYKKG